MDELEKIGWTVDFDQVIQNYRNVRTWNKGNLIGFIFGNTNSNHISNILFASPSDVETAANYIEFVESSFSTDVVFIGVLLLDDVKYAFDADVLCAGVSYPAEGLHLSTRKENLENGTLWFDDEQYIRNKKNEPCPGIMAMTTMQLDWNIKFNDEESFKEMLNAAVAEEQLNIEYVCFFNKEHHLLLGIENDSGDIESLIGGQGLRYYERTMNFTPLRLVNVEIDNVGEQRLVPVIRISKGSCKYVNVRNCITSFALIAKGTLQLEVVHNLRKSLCRTLSLVAKCIEQFSNVKKQNFVDVDSYAFIVNENLVTVCYPHGIDQSVLREYRVKLHQMFNVSMDCPVFRPSQSISFRQNSTLLRNPHERIKNYKPLGDVYLVKGCYDYYHYLQGGIDDCGWGCAYRSFQTIWSWFICQGYTDLPVPTHRQIQQSLLDYGDKDEKIVGSKQWLGSLELGYCLEKMLSIQSRILATNSGGELVDNARKLAAHFQQFGTPVMIGGGMLAHTILGVDFNSSTGECAFLVLDPHYTGEDVIQTVISKGWCGWKTPSFWKKECFYNLLFPTPPSGVI